MVKHPFYSIFKEKKKAKAIEPVCRERVLKSVKPSLDFGKMGCVILAGGQGTRLGATGPKGSIPISSRGNKTLFQIHSEKIREKGKDLHVAIMTSPLNYQQTLDYFKEHQFFGLTNLSFFSQELLPVCDDLGNLCERIQSPDGNGKAFKSFVTSEIYETWKREGVEIVQVLPIDNPLSTPFDGELLGAHEEEDIELVLRVIRREIPNEKIGVVGKSKGKLTIIEYSELSNKMDLSKFYYRNTGLFSCTMKFINKIFQTKLPWHLAHKKIQNQWVWKFETFIFDLFPYADSFKLLLSERKKCFAPIKTPFEL